MKPVSIFFERNAFGKTQVCASAVTSIYTRPKFVELFFFVSLIKNSYRS